MTKNIASIRKEYTLKQLDQKDVKRNPFDQFKLWFDDAINAINFILSNIKEQ